MKQIQFFITVFLISSLALLNTACSGSSDDNGGYSDTANYRVDVIYSGNMGDYSKQVSIVGINANGANPELIDNNTGKKLSSNSLDERSSTYIFLPSNSFSLSEKANYIIVNVNAGNSGSATAINLDVTVKVYRNGTLIDTIEESSISGKSVKIAKTYGN